MEIYKYCGENTKDFTRGDDLFELLDFETTTSYPIMKSLRTGEIFRIIERFDDDWVYLKHE